MFTLEEVENPSENFKIELPYKDANKYTWDILVFLIPEILRLHGIHGKMLICLLLFPIFFPVLLALRLINNIYMFST